MTTTQSVLVIQTGTSSAEDLAALRAAGILVLETTNPASVKVIVPASQTDRLALHAVTVLTNLPNNEQARRISAMLADKLLEDAARELRARTTAEGT